MKRPAVARRQCVWVVVLLLLDTWTVQHSRADNATDDANSRQKRLLWITTDGRLALPPGTELTITPSLSLPFVRHPPDGFLSNMAISMPFTSELIGSITERITIFYSTVPAIKTVSPFDYIFLVESLTFQSAMNGFKNQNFTNVLGFLFKSNQIPFVFFALVRPILNFRSIV